MLDISLTPSYLSALADLAPAEQQRIKKFLEKIRLDPTSGGLNIEVLDSGFVSIRANQKIRAIGQKRGEVLVLHYIGEHDAAYDWAKKRRLLADFVGHTYAWSPVEEQGEAGPEAQAKQEDGRPEYGRVMADNLLQAGMPEYVARALETCPDEDELYARLETMPQEIQYQTLAAITGATFSAPIAAVNAEPPSGVVNVQPPADLENDVPASVAPAELSQTEAAVAATGASPAPPAQEEEPSESATPIVSMSQDAATGVRSNDGIASPDLLSGDDERMGIHPLTAIEDGVVAPSIERVSAPKGVRVVVVPPGPQNAHYRLDIYDGDTYIGEYEQCRSEATIERKVGEVLRSASLLQRLHLEHGQFVVRWNGKAKEVRRKDGAVVGHVPYGSGGAADKAEVPAPIVSSPSTSGQSGSHGTAASVAREAERTTARSGVFIEGAAYTKSQIGDALGCPMQGYLPHRDGRVLCATVTKAYNPDAPDIILPGFGPEIEHWGDVFCRQKEAIPVFVKQSSALWGYAGLYRVGRWSSDAADIAEQAAHSRRHDVSRVLYLVRASRPDTSPKADARSEDVQANKAAGGGAVLTALERETEEGTFRSPVSRGADPIKMNEPRQSLSTPPLAPRENTEASVLASTKPPFPWHRPASPAVALTEEQQAIVAHDLGPALVFAVAGSGKSTALVHRVERLVREGIASPKHILATSFSRASIADLRTALSRWPHCAQVKPVTLHSTGFGLMRLTQRKGLLSDLHLQESDDTPGTDKIILIRAMKRAREERVWYAPELETLDQDDFLSYVSVCKGNLCYADLDGARLPEAARLVATQAEPPVGFPWYLDLYRQFERVRLGENWITFDDMLMTGWECLVRFPEVLAEARGRFQVVLVDEFQDVNLAQSEMLDLLTFPHRNYMAIGDDDQTIYEWRGADPRFILDFERRYGATKYLISDNFRSQASHLALANRVIERNLRREPKHLSLTRGFDGGTHVHQEGSQAEQGVHIVSLIQQALQDGQGVQDIAVLVRMYAQTPPIESALIAARIPYRVVGSVPFYKRPEILALIDYLRLGIVERGLQAGQPLAEGMISELGRLWKSVANRPTRYLSNDLGTSICDKVVLHDIPFSKALLLAAGQAERPAQRKALEEMASVLRWLAAAEEQPASEVLTALDQRLGYQDYLRTSSGFPETGQGKAANVEAFLLYAAEKGTQSALLAHLDHISQGAVGRERDDAECLKLMTMHRAKGLEWRTVFVPDCNHGTIPFTVTTVGAVVSMMLPPPQGPSAPPAPAAPPPFLEEERRLFYVAITRAKHDLHLHMIKDQPPSQFLQEAEWEKTLAEVETMKRALRRPVNVWRTVDALALARHTHDHHFARYFQAWRQADGHAPKVAERMQAFYYAVTEGGWHEALGLREEHRSVWERFGESSLSDAVTFSDLPLIVGNKKME